VNLSNSFKLNFYGHGGLSPQIMGDANALHVGTCTDVESCGLAQEPVERDLPCAIAN
jgi:hypothetical protein